MTDTPDSQDNHEESAIEPTKEEARIEGETIDNETNPPACDLVWRNGGYTMECASDEDGKLALELLKEVRFRLGRGNPDPRPSENEKPTEEEDFDNQ